METLKSIYKSIFEKDAVSLINRALRFAQKMHKEQKRNSGEPYINHPIAVANILLELGLDAATVAAALLHDVVEDTEATEEDVARLFGAEVMGLVTGVTKLAKLTFASREEEAAENFRRMLFAMAKDVRVILIKLADRLHNMRTIDSKSPAKQKTIAMETLEIYAALASRLGISYIKCELEDICMRILQPVEYQKLIEGIPLRRAERQSLIDQLCLKLSDILTNLGINGEVSGRPKHFYSIFKKMQRYNVTLEQVYDLTAIRIVVPSLKDCYEVLGMVHAVWRPIPGRFKDYISTPKANNYQSLHTSVMSSYGMPFEVQIRTAEMHKVAEYGIAAHWKYKENSPDSFSSAELDRKIAWIRDIIEFGAESSSEEFYESLKVDLYSGQVFIFTPKGDVKALSEGSTPVDFAYSVHSEVGDFCVGAKVNNKMVTLDTRLQNGDYVQIITSSNSKGPSRDWLRFVKTSAAKNRIRAFYRKEMKDEHIKRGQEILEKEAKAQGFVFSELLEKKWVDAVLTRYTLSSLEDMYASVGYGGYSAGQILGKLTGFYKAQHARQKKEALKQERRGFVSGADSAGVILMGEDSLSLRIARCCDPVPGDEIIGYISRGRGAAIHRKDCSNMRNAEKERLAKAEWAGERTRVFGVTLHIETGNTAGMLAAVTNLIAKENIFIQSLNARVNKGNIGIIILRVDLNDSAQIKPLMDKIGHIPEVNRVYRGR